MGGMEFIRQQVPTYLNRWVQLAYSNEIRQNLE